MIIGKDIKLSDSLNGKDETADRITELINLIRQEQNISDEHKQSLITNFDKVREEDWKKIQTNQKFLNG